MTNNDSWDSVSARVKQLLIFIIIIITTGDLFKAYKSSFNYHQRGGSPRDGTIK